MVALRGDRQMEAEEVEGVSMSPLLVVCVLINIFHLDRRYRGAVHQYAK